MLSLLAVAVLAHLAPLSAPSAPVDTVPGPVSHSLFPAELVEASRAALPFAGNGAAVPFSSPPILLPSDAGAVVAGDTVPEIVDLSDAYYTRLTIHRVGSYAMLPLFGLQYYLGNRLMTPGDDPSWVKSAHTTTAAAVGGLFGVNTVTGLLNLWEARDQPEGRLKRTLHSIGMIAADAGFVATGLTAEGDPDVHRGVALGSIGLSTASALMMYLWPD